MNFSGKKKIIVCFALILFFVKPTINIAQSISVDKIVRSAKSVSFYHKKGFNKWVKLKLNFNKTPINDSADYVYEPEWICDDKNVMSYGELLWENKGKFLNISRLKNWQTDGIKGKTYEVDYDKKDTSLIPKRSIFTFVNPGLAIYEQVYFSHRDLKCGYIQEYQKIEDILEQKWRVKNRDYLIPIDVKLQGDKHIYLFANEYEKIIYTLLPLKHKNILLSKGKLTETTKYNISNRDRFYLYAYHNGALKIRKNTDQKYELMSCYNEQLLNKAYDTITYNPYFILAKDSAVTDVFDMYLNKSTSDTVKSAYLYGDGYEALSRKGAWYFDPDKKVVDKVLSFNPGFFDLHGLYVYYVLLKNKADSTISYVVDRVDDYSSDNDMDCIGLKGRSKDEEVEFLTGNSHYSIFSETYKVEIACHYPLWLRVRKGNQYGIVEYNLSEDCDCYDDTLSVKNKDGQLEKWCLWPSFQSERKKEIYSIFSCANEKVVMPIAYDFISFIDQENGIALFYKDGKVGVFPKDKEPLYDKVTKVTRSFYAIERNDKCGWLDVNTNKEYYFDFN